MDTLTSAEKAIAARRLAAVRPVVAALAGIAAPEAFWELCRDELSGVDVVAGGWDIRARWFGVVVCATPRLGELGRGVTIPWRVLAALITAQQPPQPPVGGQNDSGGCHHRLRLGGGK